jgi:dienelactone hydrolase
VVGGRDGGDHVSAVATTREETPVFLHSDGGEQLFGIVTEPVSEPKGVAVIFLGAGNIKGATGPNRLYVRLARRVAALGYHALRFDYHGIGESTGEIEGFPFDRPFVDDLLAGVRCLEERGVREITVAGFCYGALTALTAADRIPGLSGVALVNPPVRDPLLRDAWTISNLLMRAFRRETVRGLADPRSRRRYRRVAAAKLRETLRVRPRSPATPASAAGVSRRFFDPLAKLVDRGTPVLIAHDPDNREYGPYRKARPQLTGLLESPGARVEEYLIAEVGAIPGVVHDAPAGVAEGEARVAVQGAVASILEEWLVGLDAVASPAA